MNLCKNETCSVLSGGDCKQQCMRTMFYHDPTIYERATISDANIIMNEYISKIYGDDISQVMNPPKMKLEEYEWIKDIDGIKSKLIDIFSDIPVNSSRLCMFYIGDDRILHHFIIFARSENSIFMLDPKNKVINKNLDILYNPWFHEQFDFDNIDWSNTDRLSSLFFGVYFWPIYNEDRSDINVNQNKDKDFISDLLERGEPTLTSEEDKAIKLDSFEIDVNKKN